MLANFRSYLIEGRQEDTEEFLGFLLNGLNDEMFELMTPVLDSENICSVAVNKTHSKRGQYVLFLAAT
ncbi:unnamed protein product [Phaedon cochleariae]|uniref:Uncharacterized protein n=1 Tax=Phaedon cochleariae TaxID=80249 RepID=A0A9N9X1Y1_PHACE|nr:unnamed protein product [Phaedon cochleariae]